MCFIIIFVEQVFKMIPLVLPVFVSFRRIVTLQQVDYICEARAGVADNS